jgi:hypothetical protein
LQVVAAAFDARKRPLVDAEQNELDRDESLKQFRFSI